MARNSSVPTVVELHGCDNVKAQRTCSGGRLQGGRWWASNARKKAREQEMIGRRNYAHVVDRAVQAASQLVASPASAQDDNPGALRQAAGAAAAAAAAAASHDSTVGGGQIGADWRPSSYTTRRGRCEETPCHL